MITYTDASRSIMNRTVVRPVTTRHTTSSRRIRSFSDKGSESLIRPMVALVGVAQVRLASATALAKPMAPTTIATGICHAYRPTTQYELAGMQRLG